MGSPQRSHWTTAIPITTVSPIPKVCSHTPRKSNRRGNTCFIASSLFKRELDLRKKASNWSPNNEPQPRSNRIDRGSRLKSTKPFRHFASRKSTSKVDMTSCACIVASCFRAAKVGRNGLNEGNAKCGRVRVMLDIMAMHLLTKCALMSDFR